MGPPVAIKDVWVDEEGTTLASLLEEASEDGKPLVKQYVLMMLSEGDVRIGNKVDDTRYLIMRQQDIPSGEWFWLPDKSCGPPCGHISDIGLTASWDEFKHTRAPPMTNRPFSPKVHYRIVFVPRFALSRLYKLHFKCYAMVLQVQTMCHSSPGITNLAVIRVSHFCTSMDISIVMLVMATCFCMAFQES